MRLVEDAMMRIVLKRIAKDIKDFRLAFVLFAAYNIMVRKLFHAFCPQLILTGFPCAGCGISYTDRKFRERDQAESGGCLLDFIFCMVFLEPVCAWKNQTDCKILAWSHSSYHTCDLSL